MKFCGKTFEDNYWNGVKIVTFQQIAAMMGVDSKTVATSFQRAKKKLMENRDYFRLDCAQCMKLKGIDSSIIYPRGMNVITESGYKEVINRVNSALEFRSRLQASIAETEVEEVKETSIADLSTDLKEVDAVIEDVVEPVDDVSEEFGVTTSATVTNVNFTEMVGLMNKTLDMLAGIVKQQSEDHKLIVEQLTENNRQMCELMSGMCSRQSIKAKDKSTFMVGLDNLEYDTWKKIIYDCVAKITNINGKQRNEVLSECYKALTKEYGYVFEQTAKEFYAEYSRSPVNSLENVWFGERKNPAYKNLMIAKLSNMYRDAEREVDLNEEDN